MVVDEVMKMKGGWFVMFGLLVACVGCAVLWERVVKEEKRSSAPHSSVILLLS